MKRLFYILTVCAVMTSFSCAKNEVNVDPIAKKTTLTLTVADETRAILGGTAMNNTAFVEGDIIKVNGEECTVAMVGGVPTVTVTSADNYEAWYPANMCSVDATGALLSCKVQPAQYYDGSNYGEWFPLWADRSVNSDASLTFKSTGGILKLTITGSSDTKIRTIRVEDKAGNGVSNAMYGYFSNNSGTLEPKADATVYNNYVVLNCGEGIALSESGTDFYIYMPARTYASGLKIRICDADHKAMTIDSSTSRTITRGGILETPTIAYTVPENLVWCEYFDSLVCGSDYINGKNGFYFTEATTLWNNFAGSEIAASSLFNTDLSSGGTYRKTFAESAAVKASERVYESPGYVAVGRGATRGLLRLPAWKYAGDVNISLDIARGVQTSIVSVGAGTNPDQTPSKNCTIRIQWTTASTASNVKNNNNAIESGCTISTPAKYMDLTTDAIPVDDTPTWNNVTFALTGATTSSCIQVFPSSNTSGYRPIYVDNIVVTKE